MNKLTKEDNVTNFSGMKLVVNPTTYEFYLFASKDMPGIIQGRLNPATTQLKYHVKRGERSDGRVTAFIEVIDMPFEVTYYAPRPEKLISYNHIEVKVNKHEYEVFNPEKYEAGLERNPPAGLNSKRKKKWHKELSHYLNAKKVQADKVAAEEAKVVETPQEAFEEPVELKEELKEEPKEEPKEETEERARIDLPPVVENEVKANPENKKPIHGMGNKECTFNDYQDGYILANIDEAKEMIIILGTPTYPDTGLQRFLIFPTEKQAGFCMKKLVENDFYKRQLVDGIRTFSITPVSVVKPENRNVPALAIHDVYKFLNSKLMKVVKQG